MQVLYYGAYLAGSYILIKLLFGWSTYHRFFKWAGPLLAAFAVASAYVLCFARLEQFFLWHLLLMSAVFVSWAVKTKRQMEGMASVVSGDAEAAAVVMKSSGNTMLYIFLSALVYLAAYAVGFVYLFNTYFLPSQ